MRLVFVDTGLTTPPTGGAHTFLAHLGAGLVARGHAVAVITVPGPARALAAALVTAGVAVKTDLWRPYHLPEERAARLARWVNADPPDVYVVSVSGDAGWLALPLLAPGVATVSIAHNDVAAFYAPLAHYAQYIDAAVGVSRGIRDRLVGHCRVPPDRAHHVPYGVRTLPAAAAARAWGRPAAPTLRVGYVGRVVHEQKRVFELVDLVRELVARGTIFSLDVVGDGADRPELERRLAAGGLTRWVRFWGWQSGPALDERLGELDALVLLSDYEGLPVALLEAMGRAVVPVVTDIRSGAPEVVVPGVNGYLVPVGAISTFADRLAALAADPELLARLRRAAWETSRGFTLDAMVHRYEELVLALAAARPHRAADPDYPVMPSCRSKYPYWIRKLKAMATSGRRQ
jgi:glycosyltransferase involved in cell wall biosynthesis